MDSSLIALYTGAVISIIGAIVTGIISIIVALKGNKKLDNITTLVDGRYSALLNELASLKELFAEESGRKIDRVSADTARASANEQASRVLDASKLKV